MEAGTDRPDFANWADELTVTRHKVRSFRGLRRYRTLITVIGLWPFIFAV